METLKRSALAGLLTAMVCALPIRSLADVGVVQLYSTPDGEYQAILLEDDENDGVDRFTGLTLSPYDARGAPRSLTLTPELTEGREVIVDGRRRLLLATRQLSMWLRTQGELPDAFLSPDGLLTISGFADRRLVVMNVAAALARFPPTPDSALARHPKAPHDDPASERADFFALPRPAAIVREYYNAELDRYVLAATQQEKSNLDIGQPGGWQRTGHYFRALNADFERGPITLPVCRYYLPPPLGDTHFYSAFAEECNAVAQRWPAAILETAEAFHVALPEAANGSCLPMLDTAEPQYSVVTAPLYRVWNGRAEANHRFTTRLSEQEMRMQEGWIAEGFGPHGTAMCVDTFDLGTFPVPKERPKTPRREAGR